MRNYMVELEREETIEFEEVILIINDNFVVFVDEGGYYVGVIPTDRIQLILQKEPE